MKIPWFRIYQYLLYSIFNHVELRFSFKRVKTCLYKCQIHLIKCSVYHPSLKPFPDEVSQRGSWVQLMSPKVQAHDSRAPGAPTRSDMIDRGSWALIQGEWIYRIEPMTTSEIIDLLKWIYPNQLLLFRRSEYYVYYDVFRDWYIH